MPLTGRRAPRGWSIETPESRYAALTLFLMFCRMQGYLSSASAISDESDSGRIMVCLPVDSLEEWLFAVSSCDLYSVHGLFLLIRFGSRCCLFLLYYFPSTFVFSILRLFLSLFLLFHARFPTGTWPNGVDSNSLLNFLPCILPI